MITGILDYLKIGLGVVAGVVLAVVYYEGAPLIKDIPYIGKIPIIGDLAIGRVQVRVNGAVTAARRGFAIEVQNVASKAKTDAEAESKRQASIISTEFNNRLSVAKASDDQSSKDLDDALAENEKLRAAGPHYPPLDGGTADILRRQGFEVDR